MHLFSFSSRHAKAILLLTTLLLCSAVNAQVLGNSLGIMQKAIGELKTIGVAVVTIAVMFCGFRMVFQAAQWKDIAPIFWGGILIGGATTIAGVLLG
jgi:type IV secretion system protein VirB2